MTEPLVGAGVSKPILASSGLTGDGGTLSDPLSISGGVVELDVGSSGSLSLPVYSCTSGCWMPEEESESDIRTSKSPMKDLEADERGRAGVMAFQSIPPFTLGGRPDAMGWMLLDVRRLSERGLLRWCWSQTMGTGLKGVILRSLSG